MLHDATSYVDITNQIKIRFVDLKQIFTLNWKSPPSKSRIQVIFATLDTKSLETVLRNFATSIIDKEDKQVYLAIDGKTLRGSFNKLEDKQVLQLLSVFDTRKQVVLAHIEIHPKSTTETSERNMKYKLAIQEIDKLGLNPSITYTTDALHTQKL